MSSFSARQSTDPLDIEIQSRVKSARNTVSQAIESLRRAKRPRYQTRKAYTQLMDVGSDLGRVKSTLPEFLQDPEQMPDPDELPEWLKERSGQIELLVRNANQSYAMARRCLEVAEQAFNNVELTFAQEEIAHLKKVQRQLLNIEANLRNYRGISRSRQTVEEMNVPIIPVAIEPDVSVDTAPDIESD